MIHYSMSGLAIKCHCLSWDKVATISRRFFQMHFIEWKCMNSNKISVKFVPKGPFNNIPALVQKMAWCRQGNKPLSEPLMVSLLTHICVTRPKWVKSIGMHLNPFSVEKLVMSMIKMYQEITIFTIRITFPRYLWVNTLSPSDAIW